MQAAVAQGSPRLVVSARAFITTADAARVFDADGSPRFTDGASKPDQARIEIDDRRRFQTIDGFGIVVTGASVDVFSRLSDHGDALLNELFGTGPHDIGLSFIRIAVGASDLSLGNYTYDDTPSGRSDPGLRAFSVERDAALIADLQKIHTISPDARFMATPWTAPAWMKAGGNLNGGELLPSAYQVYAQYLVAYVRALHERGIDLAAVSLQNEPLVNAPGYPSMTLPSASAAAFVERALGPQMRAAFPKLQLLAGDANWNERFPIEVLRHRGAARFLAGAAYHCYSGAVSQMSDVARTYPAKAIMLDECSGGGWSPAFRDNLSWDMTNLVIGATANWSRTVILGSLALDDTSGPRNGGCLNCRGLVTVHADGSFTRNVEYAVLAHIAKFVRPGAVRIASTLVRGSGVPSVAFRNVDGSTVLVLFNASGDRVPLTIAAGDHSLNYELPSGAAVTFVWP